MQTLKYKLNGSDTNGAVKIHSNELKLYGSNIEPVTILTNKTLYDYNLFIPKILILYKLIPYTMASIYKSESGIIDDIHILSVESLSMSNVLSQTLEYCLKYISSHDITDFNIIMEYINIKYSEIIKNYIRKNDPQKDIVKAISRFSFNKPFYMYFIKLKDGTMISGMIWKLYYDNSKANINKQSTFYELSKLIACETYEDMVRTPAFIDVINMVDCHCTCSKCGVRFSERFKTVCDECGYDNTQRWIKKIQENKTLNVSLFNPDNK